MYLSLRQVDTWCTHGVLKPPSGRHSHTFGYFDHIMPSICICGECVCGYASGVVIVVFAGVNMYIYIYTHNLYKLICLCVFVH